MGLISEFSIAYNSFKIAHSFIKKHRMWHFVIIPGVLNVLLFISLLMWLMSNVDGWVDCFFEWECGGEEGIMSIICNISSFTLGAMKFLLSWMIKSIFIMLYLSVYKNVVLLFYSPVIAYLIEVVDQKNKGIELPFSLPQFIKDTLRGIRIALRNILLEAVCIVVVLIMALVPIINLFQPILLWFVSAYFLGFSMMDYSLERKRLSAQKSIDYIKRNKSMATGIGSVFQLMYLVPLVGWMFAPTYAAVAAYFAVEELERIKD
jgi:CysZ protein